MHKCDSFTRKLNLFLNNIKVSTSSPPVVDLHMWLILLCVQRDAYDTEKE
jgi:hypothetical protein